jgi:hypothetical protein
LKKERIRAFLLVLSVSSIELLILTLPLIKFVNLESPLK